MEEEGTNGAKTAKGSEKGSKNKVYLEDVNFLNLENHHGVSFKHFLEKLSSDAGKEDYAYLEKKLTSFKNKKIQAQELFDSFYDVFGLKEVILDS